MYVKLLCYCMYIGSAIVDLQYRFGTSQNIDINEQKSIALLGSFHLLKHLFAMVHKHCVHAFVIEYVIKR